MRTTADLGANADVAEKLASLTHRCALLRMHARSLAHEISNLMFLAEIQSRQTTSAAGGELKRCLPLARRLARLLADALSDDPKPRTVSLTEAFEEIDTLVVKPSKGHLAGCELRLGDQALGRARFQETTAGLLLIIQDLLRQATESRVQGEETTLAFYAERLPHALQLRLERGDAILAIDGFIASECTRNAFQCEAQGQSFTLSLPLAEDDEGTP